MILLYDSGTRLAEVLGLGVSDVAIAGDNPYIRVNGMRSKQSIVPISVKTAEHLNQYISVYHVIEYPETPLLFYTGIKSAIGGMPEGNVERFVNEYVYKASPKYAHPHMFRRTKATRLYQNGVRLPLVSRLPGHASLETKRLYAKQSLKMLRDEIKPVETPEEKEEKILLGS